MDKRNCIKNYLEYCNLQKCLDQKTLKAYQIDLRQFCEQTPEIQIIEITTESLELYIARMHEQYRPKTIPLHTVELFLSTIYSQHKTATTLYQKQSALRDVAVAELLFATGNNPSGCGCGYSLHSGDAGAQFYQYYGNLYACLSGKTKEYFGCEASEEGFSDIVFG